MQEKILKELEQGFCAAYREYLMKSTDENHDYYRGYFSAFVTALKAAGVERAEEDVCYKLCDEVAEQVRLEKRGWEYEIFVGMLNNERTTIECKVENCYAYFNVDGKNVKRKTHVSNVDAKQYFRFNGHRFAKVYEKRERRGAEET